MRRSIDGSGGAPGITTRKRGPDELMAEHPKASLRRFPRIATPHGLWVAWQREGFDGAPIVSRVRDLNLGGLYILTDQPLLAGETISILFSVPEGEIRSLAKVRNVNQGEGMGVEFVEMNAENSARFETMLARLIKNSAAKES
jgi:hypothetical protein